MDWKTVAIGVLVVTAVLLGGLVASGLREEKAAYAQGGVYATYLAVAAGVQTDQMNFVVLDTEARRLLFYRVDPAKFKMEITSGRDLTRDIKQSIP